MLPGQRFEEFPDGAAFTSHCLLETTADATETLKRCLVLKEPLIGTGALNYHFCLSVHRQHGGVPRLLKSGDVVASVLLELTERVNVGEIYCHSSQSTWSQRSIQLPAPSSVLILGV